MATLRSLVPLCPSLLLLLACGCASPSSTPKPSPAADKDGLGNEPLGSNRFAVTTTSAEAQRLFDRGLVWCYAFHHAQAIEHFRAAQAADPRCAMAFWGAAYAAGPHINNMEMDDAAAQ